MRVERNGENVRVVREVGRDQCMCNISKGTAIQLAKDLLKACGIVFQETTVGDELKTASEQTGVYSGMSLDEIQTEAGKVYDQLRYDIGDGYVDKTLALLIANLAARVKEQKDQVDANLSGIRYANLQLGKLEWVEEPTNVMYSHGSGKGQCIHNRGKVWFHLTGPEEALQLIKVLDQYIDEASR